jgi:hypothetical protein
VLRYDVLRTLVTLMYLTSITELPGSTLEAFRLASGFVSFLTSVINIYDT